MNPWQCDSIEAHQMFSFRHRHAKRTCSHQKDRSGVFGCDPEDTDEQKRRSFRVAWEVKIRK